MAGFSLQRLPIRKRHIPSVPLLLMGILRAKPYAPYRRHPALCPASDLVQGWAVSLDKSATASSNRCTAMSHQSAFPQTISGTDRRADSGDRDA